MSLVCVVPHEALMGWLDQVASAIMTEEGAKGLLHLSATKLKARTCKVTMAHEVTFPLHIYRETPT